MFNKFKLRGNVSGAIRSDDEMASVNKDAADNSFKEQKKELDFFLQQKGFVKYKINSYVRGFLYQIRKCYNKHDIKMSCLRWYDFSEVKENEDRQADWNTFCITSGRENYSTWTGRTLRGFKKNYQ